jgi:hypothetical protein
VPAEAVEPPRHVLGEGERRFPRERHLVVVVERDQLAEPEMPGERRRLRGDAFHQIAVRAQHVGVVIHHLVARAVEPRGEVALGDGHAHGVRDPLAERARRRLDAGGEPELRVPGSLRSPLAEALDLLE